MGRLGKRTRKGDERYKAVPDQYPNEGPIDLSVGYDELPRAAFAVWVRLAVATDEDLRGGRRHVAGVLGYSQRRSNEVLLQLERRGYISFIPNGPWQPTTIVIERKPEVRRGCRVVRSS